MIVTFTRLWNYHANTYLLPEKWVILIYLMNLFVIWDEQHRTTIGDNEFFLNKLEVGPSKTQLVVATKPKKILNQNERFRKANKVCVKIASLASYVGGIHYQRRMELLHNLAYMWGENQEVSIKSVDHESKFLLLLLHKIYFQSLAQKY